jgi:TPR repeat protein
MMIKGQGGLLLALGVDERPPVDAREHPDKLHPPTIDERVNIYLRAVYGKRDFSLKEYSDARNVILDAMAADIASKSEIRVPEQPWDSSRTPKGAPVSPSFEYQHSYESESALSRALEDSVEYKSSYASIAYQRSYEPVELARAIGNTRIALNSQSSVALPVRKIVKRSISICAAAAVAAVVAVVLIRLLPTAWFAADPNSRVAADAVSSAAPGVVDTVAALDPEEIAGLVKRGRELIAKGEISAARLVLRRAAEAGNAPAALALGATYDPIFLEKPGIRDFFPDIAMARAWYHKAKDLGSAEAARRLELRPEPID